MRDHYRQKDITKLLGITPGRMQQWLDRRYVRPSIQKSEKSGERNLWSYDDLITLGVFEELLDMGFSRALASKLTNPEGHLYWVLDPSGVQIQAGSVATVQEVDRVKAYVDYEPDWNTPDEVDVVVFAVMVGNSERSMGARLFVEEDASPFEGMGRVFEDFGQPPPEYTTLVNVGAMVRRTRKKLKAAGQENPNREKIVSQWPDGKLG